jgi:hypothetical protein
MQEDFDNGAALQVAAIIGASVFLLGLVGAFSKFVY